MLSDIEPAALRRTARGEPGEHQRPADRHGGRRLIGIRRLIGSRGQKVENRSVMPHVDRRIESDKAHVSDPAGDQVGGFSELCRQLVERGTGDIDGLDRAVAVGDQVTDQRRCTRADHGNPAEWRRHATHKIESGLRVDLIPADFVELLGGPNSLPMITLVGHWAERSVTDLVRS